MKESHVSTAVEVVAPVAHPLSDRLKAAGIPIGQSLPEAFRVVCRGLWFTADGALVGHGCLSNVEVMRLKAELDDDPLFIVEATRRSYRGWSTRPPKMRVIRQFCSLAVTRSGVVIVSDRLATNAMFVNHKNLLCRVVPRDALKLSDGQLSLTVTPSMASRPS